MKGCEMNRSIVSLFSGAGGLDKGFEKAGFHTIWANEFDKTIWETFERNFPNTILDRRSITNIEPYEIPDSVGIIGGPPCQSWSEAGSRRGIDDERGQLFNDYIRILRSKKPKFFLVENVPGIVSKTHIKSFENFLSDFEAAGYIISWKILDAHNYGVPETRKRVIVVGYRDDLGIVYKFPKPLNCKPTLRDAIGNLDEALPAVEKNKTNGRLKIPNHEYMNGGFSSIYMSRNRVRSWEEPSFTIQASGRQAPIHPKAPKMIKAGKDKHEFVKEREVDYRRLSVRECARIQTFEDDFIFYYQSISDGYKMVGNAVPVNLAYELAKSIMQDMESLQVLQRRAS